MLVDMEIKDLDYMASAEGRVVYRRDSEARELKKQQMAHLVLMDFEGNRGSGGRGSNIGRMRGDHNSIYEFLNERKVYLECESSYRSLHMLHI